MLNPNSLLNDAFYEFNRHAKIFPRFSCVNLVKLQLQEIHYFMVFLVTQIDKFKFRPVKCFQKGNNEILRIFNLTIKTIATKNFGTFVLQINKRRSLE